MQTHLLDVGERHGYPGARGMAAATRTCQAQDDPAEKQGSSPKREKADRKSTWSRMYKTPWEALYGNGKFALLYWIWGEEGLPGWLPTISRQG